MHIASLSEEERKSEFPEEYLNRNIKDVIAHLHHWHLLFLDWYRVGMEGGKPDMPPKDISGKPYQTLIRKFGKNIRTLV